LGEKEEKKKAKEIRKGYGTSGHEELAHGTVGRADARGISEPSKKKEKPPPPE